MKFFIDPGHRWPSKDRGAEGFVKEEEVVLLVATYLQQILIKRGHAVATTAIGKPVNSITSSLASRVAQSDQFEPDLFLSIHVNAATSTTEPRGSEAFAITRKGSEYAQRCIDGLVGLGFKRRSLKQGADASHLYVLSNTQDTAILVELFFCDSKADCDLYSQVGAGKIAQALADAIAPEVKPQIPQAQPKTIKVADVIGKCDTGLIRGLSLQLIAKMNRMVPVDKPVLQLIEHPLIDSSSVACNPYLQPTAAQALIRAVEKRGKRLALNSCLRTIPQQWLIRNQFERGLCGITAAAPADKSNHSGGVAIDIQDPDDWRAALEAEGWSKLGDWDKPHYDFWGLRGDIAKIQVSAFQALWNEHNPGDLIAVDGVYGAVTGARIAASPARGF